MWSFGSRKKKSDFAPNSSLQIAKQIAFSPTSLYPIVENVPIFPRLAKSSLREMIIEDDIESIRYFLAQNPSFAINSNDMFGMTPLFLAVKLGFLETASLLIEHGADVNTLCAPTIAHENIPSGHLRSAMHAACESGRVDLVVLLLANGAARNPIVDGDYESPLEIARKKGFDEVVKVMENLPKRAWIISAIEKAVVRNMRILSDAMRMMDHIEGIQMAVRALACLTRYEESHIKMVEMSALQIFAELQRFFAETDLPGLAHIVEGIRRAMVLCVVELLASNERVLAAIAHHNGREMIMRMLDQFKQESLDPAKRTGYVAEFIADIEEVLYS